MATQSYSDDGGRSVESIPEVSVIVPHYSDLDGLDRCLSAIAGQVGAPSMEVIVADNESPQGPAAVADAIAGRARLVISHERGAGPTRNTAVGAARGAILAFTDADCVPEPQWLAKGVDALRRFDVVGGEVSVLRTEAALMSGAEAFERVFAFKNRNYIEEKGFSVTANLFCRRSVFESVGPFRNGVPEDAEWCHRARARGYVLGYEADAIVWHPPRRTWGELTGKWRRLNRESYGLASHGFSDRFLWLSKSWLLPLSIVAHLPKVARDPALSGGRERWAALKTLVALRMWRMADCHRLFFRG